jgi:hypothetical protein
MSEVPPRLAMCQSVLRRLIAAGDPVAIPLAERTINDYLDVATGCARRSGLRRLQQDAWDQHRGAVGVQRSFAETVTAYLERKLAEE